MYWYADIRDHVNVANVELPFIIPLVMVEMQSMVIGNRSLELGLFNRNLNELLLYLPIRFQ